MEHLRDDDKDAVEDMSTNKMSIDSASDACCDDLETGVDGTKVVWNDQICNNVKKNKNWLEYFRIAGDSNQ